MAYALPERQSLRQLEVADGTTAEMAVRLSGIAAQFSEIRLDDLTLGIFGRRVPATQPLRAGDRVEIYRALLADPKEVRRQLAAEGRTMGRRGRREET